MPVWLSKHEAVTSVHSHCLWKTPSSHFIGSSDAMSRATMTLMTSSKSPTSPPGPLSSATMSEDPLRRGSAQSPSTSAEILGGEVLYVPSCGFSSPFSCQPRSRPEARKSPSKMLDCSASMLPLRLCRPSIRNRCCLPRSAGFLKKMLHRNSIPPLRRLKCACGVRAENFNRNFPVKCRRSPLIQSDQLIQIKGEALDTL